MFLDQRNSFHAVLSLPDHVDLREALEQVRQLVPRRFLVVDDDGVNRHGYDVISFRGSTSRLSRRRRVAVRHATLRMNVDLPAPPPPGSLSCFAIAVRERLCFPGWSC